VNTGPRRNSNVWSRRLKTEVPVTSDGRRSGVHWTRRKSAPIDFASAREHRLAHARNVLQKHVASGEEGGDGGLDDRPLPQHHALDVLDDLKAHRFGHR